MILAWFYKGFNKNRVRESPTLVAKAGSYFMAFTIHQRAAGEKQQSSSRAAAEQQQSRHQTDERQTDTQKCFEPRKVYTLCLIQTGV